MITHLVRNFWNHPGIHKWHWIFIKPTLGVLTALVNSVFPIKSAFTGNLLAPLNSRIFVLEWGLTNLKLGVFISVPFPLIVTKLKLNDWLTQKRFSIMSNTSESKPCKINVFLLRFWIGNLLFALTLLLILPLLSVSFLFFKHQAW